MRIIAHLDMDAFFAAVEERDHDWLKGRPIVVGADSKEGKGRGVVSTANYKAREYGIHSAMPVSQAWRLSESAKRQGKDQAEFLLPNSRQYSRVSENIFSFVRDQVPLVEKASIDEAYLDLSFIKSFSGAKSFCENIKSDISKKERLTCSVGLGPNKLIAKIASDFKKPNGLTVVREKEAEEFLSLLPVRKIPGIGPKTEADFLRKNIKIVRDLKRFSKEELYQLLGKWLPNEIGRASPKKSWARAIDLYEKIRGRDETPVVEEHEVKSIGEQETFEKDSQDAPFLFERLIELSQSVFGRFSSSEFGSFRTIVLTIRFSDFKTISRSKTLSEPSSALKRLKFEAINILTPFLEKKKRPIRLIGLRIEKLV